MASILRFKAPVNDFTCFKVSPYRKETKSADRGHYTGLWG